MHEYQDGQTTEDTSNYAGVHWRSQRL